MLVTVVLSLVTALSYGVSDFLGAVGARRLKVLPGTAVTYGWALLTLLVMLPILGGAWSGETVLWGAIAGVSAIIGFVAFYAALAAGPMSLASPLIAVIGSIVPVAIALLLGERLPVLAWVAVVLALLGGGLISVTRGGRGAGIPRKTVVLSVLAGLGLGGSIAALDRAPHDSGVTAAVVEIAVGVALLGILLLVARVSPSARGAAAMLDEQQEADRIPSPARAWVASSVGGVLLGVANGVLLLALQSGSLAVVSVLVGLYPVATIVLARVVYREKLSPVQACGVVVAIAASVLLALA
jgi:drug/metabolite transporter (DMT)-like permease